MSETEKTAIAAHLYVSMRRLANRVIDIEWMGKNEDYARAIIELARQQGADELTKYADRYEELMSGKVSAPPPVQPRPEIAMRDGASAMQVQAEAPSVEEAPEHDISPDRYIGSLR